MSLSPDPVRGFAPAAPGRDVFSGNALAVASMLTWAAGFPAAEILLQSWPPLTLIVARLALTVSVLVPVWLMLDGPARVLRARWGRALWVGGIGFGVGTYLLLIAQKMTDPVTVALIVSCAPLFSTMLEMAAGTRRLRWTFGLGMGASVIGGLIATSALAPAQLGLGAACAVLSTGLYCWASMATARDFPELGQTGRAAITFVGGLLAASGLLLFSWQAGLDVIPALRFDTEQAGMLVIYALISMALSQVLFVASVGRLGIAVASFHINVAPFYVMIIMLTLGAGWNWTQALGAAIVGLGVVLSQIRPGRARR